MACWSNRLTVLFMSLGALGIGLAAIILANTLKLEACHLCIFQRMVYFVIGAVLLIAFLVWNLYFPVRHARRRCRILRLGNSVVAAQQSWLQWFSDSGLTCTIVEPESPNA